MGTARARNGLVAQYAPIHYLQFLVGSINLGVVEEGMEPKAKLSSISHTCLPYAHHAACDPETAPDTATLDRFCDGR